MSNYITVLDQKWYYRLNSKETNNGKSNIGLFNVVAREAIKNELIICMSYEDENKKNYRLYTLFKSYIDFSKYQQMISPEKRCFYEIILGDKPQKPHFDIDIDDPKIDGEKVKDELIKAIIDVLKEKDIILNLEEDILVYTSHSFQSMIPTESIDSNKKQSYHIIINNWCHANNNEAKAFYEIVKERMDKSTNEKNEEQMSKYVDHAVYGQTQQFRIIGSQKIGTSRVKKAVLNWEYFGKKITHFYIDTPEDDIHEINLQLEESLITFTAGCQILPLFVKSEVIKKKKTYTEVEDISNEIANDAINLIASVAGTTISDERFPYRFKGISGPIVMLERIKPSMCRICHRIHEHENPFLLIVGEERNVYFNCRRSPQMKNFVLVN